MEEPKKTKRRSILEVPREEILRWELFLLGMVVGALLLATVQAYTGKGLPPALGGPSQPAGVAGAGGSGPTLGPVDTSKLTIRTANVKGPMDAPVTVYEFADFQCPFCRQAFQSTNQQLLDTYVAQGKVRFVYKQYAILGQESTWAAEASECAADQGQFWAYHDELFKQAGLAGAENVGAFTKDKLEGYAGSLGLDLARFKTCLENDETLSRVQADINEGNELQVTATPTFFIGDQRLIGAQPWQEFVNVIEAQLKP